MIRRKSWKALRKVQYGEIHGVQYKGLTVKEANALRRECRKVEP